MGANIGANSPNQNVISPPYRNLNQPQAVQPQTLQVRITQPIHGRRGIPGGPILPKLPPNPGATAARRIGIALNTPAKWPSDDTL